MIRSKLAAGIVAVGTAVAVISAPAATAQEVGAPQQIGNLPSSSSEYFFQGLRQMSSDDEYLRQDGSSKIYLSPWFSSFGIGNFLSPILVPLSSFLNGGK